MITKPIPGQLIAGAGGVLLILALFLPWADVGGTSRNGWELWTMADIYFLIAAVTGGHYGVFRPDVSLNAATDLFGVVATVLIAWLLLFDFPEGASREVGVWLALLGAATIAGGAGDYKSASRGDLFPRVTGSERR